MPPSQSALRAKIEAAKAFSEACVRQGYVRGDQVRTLLGAWKSRDFEGTFPDLMIAESLITPRQREDIESLVASDGGALPCFPGFVVEEALGAEPTGRLYRATRDGQACLLRRVPSSIRRSPESLQRLREAVESYRALESRAIPLVELVEAGEDGPVLVRSAVAGTRLNEFVQRGGPFPAASAGKLAARLITHLTRAHAAELAHGTLRPGAIRVAPDREVVLADFGLERVLLELTGSVEAPEYRSWLDPFERGAASISGDLYGLGAVLFYVLTAQIPSRTEDPAEAPPDPRETGAQVPEALATMVSELLSAPDKRPAPEALEERLREALAAPQRPGSGRFGVSPGGAGFGASPGPGGFGGSPSPGFGGSPAPSGGGGFDAARPAGAPVSDSARTIIEPGGIGGGPSDTIIESGGLGSGPADTIIESGGIGAGADQPAPPMNRPSDTVRADLSAPMPQPGGVPGPAADTIIEPGGPSGPRNAPSDTIIEPGGLNGPRNAPSDTISESAGPMNHPSDTIMESADQLDDNSDDIATLRGDLTSWLPNTQGGGRPPAGPAPNMADFLNRPVAGATGSADARTVFHPGPDDSGADREATILEPRRIGPGDATVIQSAGPSGPAGYNPDEEQTLTGAEFQSPFHAARPAPPMPDNPEPDEEETLTGKEFTSPFAMGGAPAGLGETPRRPAPPSSERLAPQAPLGSGRMPQAPVSAARPGGGSPVRASGAGPLASGRYGPPETLPEEDEDGFDAEGVTLDGSVRTPVWRPEGDESRPDPAQPDEDDDEGEDHEEEPRAPIVDQAARTMMDFSEADEPPTAGQSPFEDEDEDDEEEEPAPIVDQSARTMLDFEEQQAAGELGVPGPASSAAEIPPATDPFSAPAAAAVPSATDPFSAPAAAPSASDPFAPPAPPAPSGAPEATLESSAVAEDPWQLVGKEVDRYTVTGLRDADAIWVRYDATIPGDDSTFLVMVPRPDVLGDAARQAVVISAQALGRLEDRGFAHFESHGELPNGEIFLAYRAVTGTSLRSALSWGGMDFARASRVIEGLLASFAHSRSIDLPHGDLNADKVTLCRDAEGERLVVTDFTFRSVLQAHGVSLPAPADDATTAPEVRAGGAPTHASDLFSIAALGFMAMTGEPPFGDLNAEPRDLETARTDWAPPEGLSDLYRQALAKDPAQRFSGAEEFLSQLRRLRGEVGVEVERRRTQRIVQKGSKTGLIIGVVVVIGLLLVAGAVGIAWKLGKLPF